LGQACVKGEVILLYAEQGLGDTIQFCRYIKLVEDLGFKIVLDIPASLKLTMKTLRNKFIFIDENKNKIDYVCSLMSLPNIFKTTINTIPVKIPYLYADENKKSIWKQKIKKNRKINVGLIWSGGFREDMPETWDVNSRRNIELDLLKPISDIPNINLYSVQKGDPAESELKKIKKDDWKKIIINLTSEIKDFSDTAALIANLDLIISVDTSTAHLAAAMGAETWILNRYDTCWRWLDDGRQDSPWYPSVRLFRQTKPGDWQTVINQLCHDLKNYKCIN
jgi:hypothetical protein